ncbi:MAG: hypothetical protein CVU14_04835 [Bacteroidetes bacterium HGW-Bacteroidetes-9]|jgi:hypothetical protein|nr:MAG: hypothetical protein CVU14_04835 [Bacteroidetes bacterium HGW-Bacteroidetes-9]
MWSENDHLRRHRQIRLTAKWKRSFQTSAPDFKMPALIIKNTKYLIRYHRLNKEAKFQEL